MLVKRVEQRKESRAAPAASCLALRACDALGQLLKMDRQRSTTTTPACYQKDGKERSAGFAMRWSA